MSRFLSPTPIVAYASIVAANLNNDNDLNLLRRWCARIPIELEILAEEVPPSESHRPLWMEIMEQIERGTVTTLIVPSLFHIAGEDFISLAKVLTFLKVHGVTLKSLAEVIDSRRDSKHEIILRLVNDTKTATAVRGAQ